MTRLSGDQGRRSTIESIDWSDPKVHADHYTLPAAACSYIIHYAERGLNEEAILARWIAAVTHHFYEVAAVMNALGDDQ